MSVTDSPSWSPPTASPVVVRPRTVFALVLDDDRFGGLAIKMRSQTFDEWTTNDTMIVWPGDDANEAAKNGYFRRLAERFVSYVVEWNLTDHQGAPEPVGLPALLTLDRAVVLDLIKAWGDAQNGKVDVPLDEPSPDGKPSVEATIPMEAA